MAADELEQGVRVVCAACGHAEVLDDDRPVIQELVRFRARHDHATAGRQLVPAV